MRNTILILSVASLLGLSAAARSLSPSEALDRALGLSSASVSRSAAVTVPVMTIGDDAAPALYVFATGDQGYMIVSADDVAAPVIGYSDKGTIDPENLPDNFLGWLEQSARQIRQASEAGLAPYSAVRIGADHDPIAPLMTTEWNQNYPFNSDCPRPGYVSYTGCVATAMAQVMKYHNWPDKVVDNAVLTAQNPQVSADFSNFEFDWANMLDSYGYYGSYNDTQASAVSKLMQACGYSVNMSYDYGMSGTYSELVGGALVDYFKYDTCLHNEPRDLYSTEEWDTMVYDNLRDFGPMVYWGGIHCFVCDGYQADGYYHFNWGWGGLCDGYFLLDALNPQGTGIGGSDSGYSDMQSALFGIRPAVPGSELQPRRYTFYMHGPTAAMTQGSYVYIDAEYANRSPYAIKGKYLLMLYNEDGTEFLETCTVYRPGTANNVGYTAQTQLMGLVPNTVPSGVYRLYPAVAIDGIDEPFRFTPAPGSAGYVIYKRDNGRNSIEIPQADRLTVEQLNAGGELLLDKRFTVSGLAKYTGAKDANMFIQVTLVDQSGSVCATGSGHTLLFAPDGVRFEFVSDWFYKKEGTVVPGDYTLAISQVLNGRYVHLGTCPVKIVTELSGLDSVTADSEAPVEYYNLQGIRVSDAQFAPGIYIRRQGSKVSKIAVK